MDRRPVREALPVNHLGQILHALLIPLFSVLPVQKHAAQATVPLVPIEYIQNFPSPSPTLPSVTLITTGDVMLGRAVYLQTLKTHDPLFPFQKTYQLLSSGDMTLVNLENPLVDPCPTTGSGMIFCAPTSQAEALKSAGIDIVNIANNHTKNYGELGYQSTISALTDASIRPSDSQALVVIEKGGMKFGFLGFDLTGSQWTDAAMIQKLTEAKERVDVLTVSLHWGTEYRVLPTEEQRRLARRMVDHGANLIIGHHPHVVEPVELYQGVPIVYSHGNFVFDQMWSRETRQGIVGRFVFQGQKLVSYDFTPVFIATIGQPQEVTDENLKQQILKRLTGE